MRSEFDHVVIGGGAIGMAVAFQVVRDDPGKSVGVVTDRSYGGASTAAGAMLGCFSEVTLSTFSHPAAAAKFDLMLAAHKAWPAHMEAVESAAAMRLPHRPGTHIVLNARGGQMDELNFNAVIEALEKFGEPFQTVEPRSIVGLEPDNFARPLRAVFLPNEGSIDSEAYLSTLEVACKNLGVDFIDGHVDGRIEEENGGYRFAAGNETIRSHSVTIAAGAATGRVVEKSGLGIEIMPVLSGLGAAMVTVGTDDMQFENTVRTANRAGSCGLHLVPLGGGRQYIGATNILHSSPQNQTTLRTMRHVTALAMDELSRKLESSYVEQWRVGNRPVALDTMPMLGETSRPNVFIVTGTYRDGFHCSPVIAEGISRAASGGVSGFSDWFKPERRPISLKSQQASADEFAIQEVSCAYEGGMTLPCYMSDEKIGDLARDWVIEFYDRYEMEGSLSSDVLLYLRSVRDKSVVEDYLRRNG